MIHIQRNHPVWPIAVGLPLLLLVAAAIFWPATSGPFIFDDFPNLQNLQQLSGVIDRVHIGQYLAAFPDSPGRPLSALSFLIEDAAWPSTPLPFKRDNLLLHLLAGVLVFALARRIARLHERTEKSADVIALAAAAVWLLHPIQLSATMLVVQRMNILSTIFMLAGLLAYLASLRATSLSPFARVALAGTALGTFGLIAFLCKENGALIFAYACALNLTLLRPHISALPAFQRHLLRWGVTTPMLALVALAAINIQTIVAGYTFRDFTLAERLLTESRIVVDYLRLIFLPRIGGQGIFHDDYPVSHGLLQPPSTLVCILLLAAVVAAAWHYRARFPIFAFAVLWFVAGHLIESTVVPLELYFEHRNYLPMMGPIFAMCATVAGIGSLYRRLAWAIFGAWLGLATLLTGYNATIWGDRGKLAHVWHRENPDSVRSIQFLAAYQFDEGDHDAAKATLVQGLAMRPDAGELAFQSALANCLTSGLPPAEQNRLERLASEVHFSRVVPEVIRALRFEVLGDQCKGTYGEAAFEHLVMALMRNPQYARDNNTLGFLYYELAKLPLRHRDLDRLMYYLDKSYAYRPNPAVPREQAVYLLTAGLPDEALRYLDTSDNTPQPAFKRWMLDIRTANKPLRESAERMQRAAREAVEARKQ